MLNNFVDNLDVLCSHADRISRGDKDMSQDILGMTYKNFDCCINRGKNLSVGEMIQFMEYRGKDLRSGERNSISCISNNQPKRDVYHKRNYLNGDVEVLSLEYDEGNSIQNEDSDGKGLITTRFATRDFAEDVLLEISLEQFFKNHSRKYRKLLDLKTSGYTMKEISVKTGIPYYKIRNYLKSLGQALMEFFDMPESFIKSHCFSSRGNS